MIRMLGAVEPHRYQDAEVFQLQAGHSGTTAGMSKQYKRRSQTLKQALVEVWTTTPVLRDPRLLRDF